MGFKPLAAALTLEYSTSWDIKTNDTMYKGAGQLVDFVVTCERNETWSDNDLNCRNNKEIAVVLQFE